MSKDVRCILSGCPAPGKHHIEGKAHDLKNKLVPFSGHLCDRHYKLIKPDPKGFSLKKE